jgi:hypothetical protein
MFPTEASNRWASEEVSRVTMFTETHYLALSWAKRSQSIPSLPISVRYTSISSHQCLCLLSDLFLPGFPTITLFAFLCFPMHATSPNHCILFHLVVLLLLVFDQDTDHEAPHYVIYCNFLSLGPSQVQIYSSASCSQTPLLCVLPIIWQTKFNTHIIKEMYKI